MNILSAPLIIETSVASQLHSDTNVGQEATL